MPVFLGINLFCSAFLALQVVSEPKVATSVGFKVFAFVFAFAIGYSFLMLVNLALQIILVFSGKNRGLVGAMELEIRDDGLVEKTEVSESLFRWTGFHKIRSSRNFLFLYVTESNALYVPRRFFHRVRTWMPWWIRFGSDPARHDSRRSLCISSRRR